MVLLVHCTFSPSEPLLEFARDIFLFSFYTRGMSLVDIVFLRKEHIFDNAIHYVRHKSSQPLRITITEPLAALIAKYDNDSPIFSPFCAMTPRFRITTSTAAHWPGSTAI